MISEEQKFYPKERNHKEQASTAQDGRSIRPAPPPTLELDSNDDKVSPPKLLGKRNSDKRLMDDEKTGFTMASYNSAFLEDLFEDLAAKSNDEDVGNKQVDHSNSISTPNDFCLIKRRRVSTTKSLAHCGKSHANLASCFLSSASPVSKKSSVMMTTTKASKTTMKELLPATISASYSFQLDNMKVLEPALSNEGLDIHCRQGDFGWFVDTDVVLEGTVDVGKHNSPCASSDAPLTFSATAAPQASHRDHQAEEEWARAADTVDAVLGDLF